ncbi:MAG: sortase, partial [Acidimicrobiia bacterium]|nr:sortase [Acidimicrobiia bacterium]
QSRLQNNFSSTLDKVGRIDPAILKQLQESTTTSIGQTATTAPPATIPREVIDLVSPQPGEAMAVIHIPKIKVERRVVEGTEVDDLRKGPGHYPGTPLPGQTGNAAIAGHRTTYGAPFNRIDELAPGDEISIQTVQGTAVYQVDTPPVVVSPTQVEVLRDFGDSRLTLTSCHPKLSAAQRMVVTAKLVSAPFPALPASSQDRVQADVASTTTIAEGVENTVDPAESTTTAAPTTTSSTSATADSTAPAPVLASESPAPDLQQGLGGDRSALPSAIGWGLATAAAGFVAWLVSRRWDHRIGRRSRLRHIAVYALLSPAFFVLLFLCFENVDRLLPAY